jgi:hypothetical protein
MDHPLELGIDAVGDVTVDASGTLLRESEVIRDVVAKAVLPDQMGVDFIGGSPPSTHCRTDRPR